LDHEIRDDPVENRAVEVFVVDVFLEVFGTHRRFFREELDREIAV
jgi:hypothetical protein